MKLKNILFAFSLLILISQNTIAQIYQRYGAQQLPLVFPSLAAQLSHRGSQKELSRPRPEAQKALRVVFRSHRRQQVE